MGIKLITKNRQSIGINNSARLLRINYISFIGISSVILMILLPHQAFASDGNSISYKTASQLITAIEGLSLFLYFSIASAYSSLFVKIATIGLTIILSKYLLTRNAPLKDMVNFCLTIVISSSIAFNADVFKSVFYDTFFNTLYKLDQFIIQSAAENMPGIRNLSFNSLAEMFAVVDNSFAAITDFAFDVAHHQTGLLGSLLVKIEAVIVAILYIFTGCYFLVIFTVSILSAHMMLVLMPVTISLYPFRKFRGYFSNCVKGMLHYALVTLFACVAVSLAVYITNDLSVEAERLLAIESPEIPADFLKQSLMAAFISILLIKMSSEFSSRVLATVSSELGNAFPMIVSGGMTMFRMSYKAALTTGSVISDIGNYAMNRASNQTRGKNMFAKNIITSNPNIYQSSGKLGK